MTTTQTTPPNTPPKKKVASSPKKGFSYSPNKSAMSPSGPSSNDQNLDCHQTDVANLAVAVGYKSNGTISYSAGIARAMSNGKFNSGEHTIIGMFCLRDHTKSGNETLKSPLGSKWVAKGTVSNATAPTFVPPPFHYYPNLTKLCVHCHVNTHTAVDQTRWGIP